jgi:hypothetical protein
MALKIQPLQHKEFDNSMGVLPYYGGSNLIASETALTFRGSDAQGAQLSAMGGKSLSRQGYHDLKSSFPVCRLNRASESFDGFLGDGQTQSRT